MSLRSQIQTAYRAHEIWRARLATALASGSSPFSPEEVLRDDLCTLGQWLHSLPESARGAFFGEVKSLHAAFHAEAHALLALATGNRRAEVEAASGPGSPFNQASEKLAAALLRWVQSEPEDPLRPFPQ